MRKLSVILLLALSALVSVGADGFTGRWYGDILAFSVWIEWNGFYFNENGTYQRKQIVYQPEQTDTVITNGNWTSRRENGVSFISLDGNESLLLCNNDAIVFSYVDEQQNYDGKLLFAGSSHCGESSRFSQIVFPVDSFPDFTHGFRSSGSLSEGSVVYAPDNIGTEIEQPWIEAADGAGTGEWIEFELPADFAVQTYRGAQRIQHLVISNGFVTSDDPRLYRWNSRIKRFLLECDGWQREYSLPDTAELVTVTLPRELVAQNSRFPRMRLTILETWPGERWQDTSLNLIMGLGTDE